MVVDLEGVLGQRVCEVLINRFKHSAELHGLAATGGGGGSVISSEHAVVELAHKQHSRQRAAKCHVMIGV